MRRRLATGIYLPGSLLPRQRTLAQEFGVSPLTFRRAIEPLFQAGFLIPSVKPRGTLVGECVPQVEAADC
jgi:DNA-binding GntR family transcriptional regulator